MFLGGFGPPCHWFEWIPRKIQLDWDFAHGTPNANFLPSEKILHSRCFVLYFSFSQSLNKEKNKNERHQLVILENQATIFRYFPNFRGREGSLRSSNFLSFSPKWIPQCIVSFFFLYFYFSITFDIKIRRLQSEELELSSEIFFFILWSFDSLILKVSVVALGLWKSFLQTMGLIYLVIMRLDRIISLSTKHDLNFKISYTFSLKKSDFSQFYPFDVGGLWSNKKIVVFFTLEFNYSDTFLGCFYWQKKR